MVDQYSGEMLIELERKVEKSLGGISFTDGDTIFNIGPEVDLDLLRQAMLSSGREGTFSPDFKAAMVNLIDRVKSDNPSPADVAAAWAK